jgi:hypothetical protein
VEGSANSLILSQSAGIFLEKLRKAKWQLSHDTFIGFFGHYLLSYFLFFKHNSMIVLTYHSQKILDLIYQSVSWLRYKQRISRTPKKLATETSMKHRFEAHNWFSHYHVHNAAHIISNVCICLT